MKMKNVFVINAGLILLLLAACAALKPTPTQPAPTPTAAGPACYGRTISLRHQQTADTDNAGADTSVRTERGRGSATESRQQVRRPAYLAHVCSPRALNCSRPSIRQLIPVNWSRFTW